MNDAMMTAASLLSAALPAAGFAGMFFLWWPLRKTGAVRALPWFMGALVLSWAISTLSKSAWALFTQRLNEPQFGGEFHLKLMAVSIVLGAVWKLLVYVLLLANAGYLLDRLGFASVATRVLKRIYDFTTPLGVALLVASAGASGMVWIVVNVVMRVREIEG